MGSGTGSPLIPPGRPKTDDGPRHGRGADRNPRSGSQRSPRKLVISSHQSDAIPSVLRRLSMAVRCALKMSAIKFKRAISTGKLNALPRLHTRPINVVVYHGSWGELVSRWVSRLDAFSGYPVRT